MLRWGQVAGFHHLQSFQEHIGSTSLDISGRSGGESWDTAGDNFGNRRSLLQPQLGEFDIHWRRPDCSKMLMVAEEGWCRSTNLRIVAIPSVLRSVLRRQFRG